MFFFFESIQPCRYTCCKSTGSYLSLLASYWKQGLSVSPPIQVLNRNLVLVVGKDLITWRHQKSFSTEQIVVSKQVTKNMKLRRLIIWLNWPRILTYNRVVYLWYKSWDTVGNTIKGRDKNVHRNCMYLSVVSTFSYVVASSQMTTFVT